MTSPIANITIKNQLQGPRPSNMRLDKTQLLDQLEKSMRRGTISGVLGKKMMPHEKVVVKNSFNSLSDDTYHLEKLISKTVKDSHVNSAMTNAQIAELKKEMGNKGYLNTKYIDWPPTRESFKILC